MNTESCKFVFSHLLLHILLNKVYLKIKIKSSRYLNGLYGYFVWKRLNAGTVPENKEYAAGTVPANKEYAAGTLSGAGWPCLWVLAF